MLPPGPAPLTYNPLSLYLHARRMGRDPTLAIGRRFEQYGDLYHARFFGRDVFATRHPEHVKQVLITQADRFQKPESGIVARQLRNLLGDGLLNSDGELWRRQRRLIQPAFRRERLLQYMELVITLAEEFTRRQVQGTRVDVSSEMMSLTLRIVARALFDRDAQGETDRVGRAVHVFRRAFGGVGGLLPRWIPTAQNREIRRAVAELDAMIYELLAEKRGSSALIGALASALDERGQGMSERQVRDELLTLLLAGHETTSHALSWTFHLLAQHPEIEARARAEARSVLGPGRPNPGDVDKLVYIEQVLNEAMRLYPPAYVIARECARETVLGGYVMRPGMDAVLWIYHVHRDARWWPEPARFDPERFAPKARLPEAAYLPFGLGTRTCIGKQFALMEAKLVLGCVLRELSFVDRSRSPVQRDLAVTMAPRGGLPMEVERV